MARKADHHDAATKCRKKREDQLTPPSPHEKGAPSAGEGHNQFFGRITVEFDVPAVMRDGVTLRANVYRPEGLGPWPTLLVRQPYDKDGAGGTEWMDPVQIAHRGFMVVIQDTRGRYASEGEWDPLAFEREDGYDSVEWAARLPGSNGRVGMYGSSYFGHTQWAAAAERPPSLAAISPAQTWSDPMDGLFARGGAVELGVTLPWTLQMGPDYLSRQVIAEEERDARIEALVDEYDSLAEDGYWDLPVNECAVVRRHGIPELGCLRVPDDPSIAARCRVSDYIQRVTVPSFHVAGWHDIFLQGTLDNFEAMAASGRDARLIVGPWSHTEFTDRIGEQVFGLRASLAGVPVQHGDVIDRQLAWLGSHLGLSPNIELSEEPPVRLFVMGRNVWRDESSWPLASTETQTRFMRADGSLSLCPPDAVEPYTEFDYDPADPVPTIGGQTVMLPAFPPGPIDQARIESRGDVCVFTSEPLRQEVEVTGQVRVVLHAQSSAPSTDWVARLCDVHPDGRSFNLCDGIVRLERHADRLGRCEIDLWSTSNVFLAGHRIRVHVTSSSFPRWDRNLNTGDQRAPRYQIAHQRVYHDVEHPSFIDLPVRAG